MTKTIQRFLFSNEKKTMSYGRNGRYYTTGIEVFDNEKDIQVTGVTSTGNAASGCITIPKEEVINLIELLKNVL